MNYIYNNIQREDIPFIFSLFNNEEYKSIFFEHKTSISDWYNRYEDISDFEIIIENGNRIGVINILDGEEIDILLIALQYDYTGRRYGHKIFEDIILRFGNKTYEITVKESNTRAIQFYKKLGFLSISSEIQDLGVNGKHKYLKLRLNLQK